MNVSAQPFPVKDDTDGGSDHVTAKYVLENGYFRV
jgi:hypothetical protein